MRSEKNLSGFDEGIKIIDGVPSAVHCLIMELKKSEAKKNKRGAHYHNYIEMLYGVSGEVEAHIFDEVINFKKGDLLVINPREPHTFFAVTDSAQYIVAKFLPEVLYSAENSVSAIKYVLPFLLNSTDKRVFTAEEIGYVGELMEEMMEEWQSKKHGFDLIVRANIIKTFAKVIRFFKSQNTEEQGISYEVYAAVEKALDYVAEEYQTADARTAAEICNLSYSYFSRNFKKVVKRSFSEYVNYIRLIEAERMMFTTDKSITEIAADTGFATTSHFIKRFKEYKNISPKQFRLSIGK